MLPLHPHCHCRYIGHYSKVNKIVVKNPQLSTMQKFSLNEQRQIVGSHAKLQEFHNGEDITKLFNRIRPDYPLGYYRDVFGYNGGMKKFDKINITHIEKSVIKEWTEDSTNIKMTMWGITKTHTHQANTLFELFYKYNPNIKKNSTLYRGMSFNKKDFISYGYGDISKGDLHSPDSMAIVSFSSDKREAFKYADFNKTNTYKVFYILENEMDAFDISKLSVAENESENIITKNVWYNVEHIKTYKRGEELWKIIKINQEKK